MSHLHDHEDVEHIDLSKESTTPVSHGQHHMGRAVETREEYKKLGFILLGILLVAVSLTTIRGWTLNRFMCDFMAVFFMTFAAFKFWDIEGFVHGYRKYDVIAQRFRPWAYMFPFIEAGMGFWYLMSEGPMRLNLLVLLITGTASIGVFREINRKSRFMCACLGSIIRLPLSRVSLVENVAMFAMACFMIVF